MNGDETFRPLADELARWRSAGRQPRFWLRDDDAIEPTNALDTLLDITRRHAVPVALAVIPSHTGIALARRLADESHVTVAVHGWSHDNHAPAGSKKQELGLHRPAETVCAELSAGLARLTDLHGSALCPMLVPPWNRIDAALIPRLAPLGFVGLSVFGRPLAAPLPVINSTVDIMDWHGTRGCRDHAVLVAEIVGQLREAYDDPKSPPLGLLTHHLVHDESAWIFLEKLFAATSASAPGAWLPLAALLPDRLR